MAISLAGRNKKIDQTKARRFLILFSLFILFTTGSFAQVPAWFGGTPAVTPHVYSEDFRYGITQPGRVYVILMNSNYALPLTSTDIRNAAVAGPLGGRISTWNINVPAGSTNTVFTVNAINQIGGNIPLIFDSDYTLYFVAASSTGVLQAAPVRIYMKTLACPDIYFLNALQQTIKCVNYGATSIFNISVDPNPEVSGILAGTTWVINWGDGVITNFTSAFDNDIPTLAMRTHTYVSVSDCNYVFSCGVKNLCGKTFSPQYVAIVHGRDIPLDGDGILRIVNNANGSSVINVCAGTQTIITLRDNSIWNCQNPTVPGGLTAVPNLDPRNIEWLYGRDPLGAITNTITGAVNIATLGNAPQASGRLSPIPTPTTLSQAITIPATCVAGQYFRVYLKNWNKCNWTDPEYVSAFIDINVIGAPPAPTVPDVTICSGGTRTLTVTSPAVGTLTWYSDAGLSNVVGFGNTYVPAQTAPGAYSFWVNDQSMAGLMCIGPATEVTLTIREALARPSTITGPANSCPSVNGLVFSVVGDPPVMPFGGPTQYVWSVPAGLTIASGQGTRQITVNVGATSGAKTISVILQYTTSPTCSSSSRTTSVTIYSVAHNPGAINGNNICPGGTVNIGNTTSASTGAPASSGPTYSWDRAPGPLFTTWTSLAGSSNTFSETMATTGTYRYRRTATFGCGPSVNTTVDVNVYSTANVGGAISGSNICAGAIVNIANNTPASTGIPASAGPTYSWERSPSPFSTWTALAGSAATFSETMATPGTYRYRRTAAFGCGSNVTATTADIIVFSTTHNAGTITASDICPGGTVNIANTVAATTGIPASTGPTYSWERSPGPLFSTWTALVGAAATFSEVIATTGTYRYRRTATFGCGPAVSTTVNVNVYSTTHNAGAIAVTNICAGSIISVTNTTPATTGAPASAGPNYSWERAPGPLYSSWTPLVGAAATFSETMLTAGTYRYRRTASFGCGIPVTTTADVIVFSTTHNAGVIAGTNICAGALVNITSSTSASTGIPASAGPTYSWERAPAPLFSTWTALPGVAATFSESMATPGTYRYRRTASFTCGTPVSTTTDITVNPNPVPLISGSNDVCAGSIGVPYTTALIAGHTYAWAISGGAITGGAGTNTITVTWGAAGAGWVRVTETISATGCFTTTPNYAVTINPGPPSSAPVFVSGATDICLNGTLNLDVTDVLNASSYIWDFQWVGGTNNATTAVSQISIDLTGMPPGTYTVTVQASNGCGSGPWMPVHSFDINDIPDLSPLTNTVCSDALSGITLSITNTGIFCSGITYNIISINNNGLVASAGAPATGNGLPANVIADDAWTNTTGNNVNVVYTVLPVSSQGCSGLQENVTLTVKPKPVITSGLTETICNGGTTNRSITTTNSPAIFGVTYTWPAPIMTGGITGGTARAAASGSPITDTFVNNTTAPQTATYTITPLYNGCTGNTGTVVITVNPTAQVNNISDVTYCNNATTVIIPFSTDRTVGATTYTWTNSNTSIGLGANGSGSIPSFTAANAGTAPVSATITVTPSFSYNAVSCTGPSKTFTVTVNPTAQVNNISNVTYCNNATTVLIPFSTDRTVGSTTYSWTNSNTAIGLGAGGIGDIPSFTAANAGTAPISATITVTPSFSYNSVSCTGPSKIFIITVNPTAQVNNISNVTYCNNATTVLIPFSTDRTVGSTTYTWTNSNMAIGLGAGGIGDVPSFTAINAGTAPVSGTITVTPSFSYNAVSCSGPAKIFIITVNPAAQVNNISDVTYCNNATTVLIPFSTDRTVGATTYTWTNSNTSIGLGANGSGSIPSFTAANAGTAPVSATITVTPSFSYNALSCTGPAKTFTVTVNPSAQVNNISNVTYCNNATTILIPFTTDRTAGITTYTWTNSNTAIGLAAGGTGNVPSFTAANGGTAPISATITVTPSFSYNSLSCSGPAKTFIITVNPTAQVNNISDVTNCNNATTIVIPFSTDRTVGATTYTWTNSNISIGLGANGSGSIPSFTASNAGTAPVSATITVTPSFSYNAVSCTGPSKTFTITVNPTAQVNNISNVTYCNNAPTVLIPFSTDRTVGSTTYSWTNSNTAIGLGAGGIGDIPSFTAVNAGTAPVSGTITVTPSFSYNSVSCTGPSKTFIITVNPTAQVNNISNVTYCNNATTVLIPFSTDRTIGSTTYTWTNSNTAIGLGAGGIGDVPSFTATNAGTTPISATITVTPLFSYNSVNCTGPSKTFTITVNPTAQVNSISNVTYCNNVTTVLIPFSSDRTGGSTTYSWTNTNTTIGIGANGNGDIASFTAINNGTLPVTATITVTPSYTNNSVSCTGPSETFTITVNPTPRLSTTLTPADVCSNSVFSYIPNSLTPGTTFSWTRAAVAGITPSGPASGINSINETLINITSAPVTVTYQYTLAANGCTNVQNVVVHIRPEPVITPGQNPSLCSGNALNYRILLDNFTNPADNVTFTWSAPVLAPVSPAFTGGTARGIASAANMTDAFHNTTGLTGSATYTVTPFKNGCAGAPVTIVVTIGSQPVLDPGLNKFACSNTEIGLILQKEAGSVDPAYYNIISKTVDGTLIDAGNATLPIPTGAANALFGDKYINTTGADKIVTYRIQPVLPPDCLGEIVDVIITIHPQPVIFPAQLKTVCSGVLIGKEILLTPNNTPAGTLFNWPVPVISDGSLQGTAGVNVAADPAGTIHINDRIRNYSGGTITATYMVTPVSAFGCIGEPTPVVITINPEPIPKPISGRDKICINDNGVVYNVTATGGSTFHWTVDPSVGLITFDFNTNAIIIQAAAVPGTGNVTVYETNSYLCNGAVSTLPVEVLTKPDAEVITGPVAVCTNSTQVYSVTNRIGSSYSWTIPGGAAIVGDPSASSITVIFANVGGTISVRETNSAGCITNHTPKSVTVNPLPTATISGGGTICQGGSRNLSVVFTGIGPYAFTYAIDGVPQPPVATSANPYSLNVTAAGTYTIINVSDANCTNNGTGTTTISYFPKPVGIISGTAEICRGASTVLTMTFTGAAPYTFTYSDGTTPVTVTGHPTNVYTVSVSPLTSSSYTLTSFTDGNGCAGDVSGSAAVTVNLPPSLTLTGTNLICYNVNTGTINMTIADGTAPFGVSWTGPNGFTATTQNISSLASGFYAVVVTDSKGCTGTANITLSQPPLLTGSAAGTNITCFGANDGTITISGVTGGTGTYEYTINGGGTWQVSSIFTGLTPGTYNVRMRDAVNPTCILTLNSSLLLTGPAILNASVVKTDVTCFGTANGSIIISNPAGGYGTYGYSVNGGATWQPSGTFANLANGIYNVQIRDAANPTCVITLVNNLIITQPAVLSASVASTPVTCFGSADGMITISSPAGGHGNYEYSINGGGSWQASGNYSALSPGAYNVQIHDKDFPGCFVILDGSLTITQPARLSATFVSTNITCNGAADGRIDITAPQGGYGTYEYTINGGTDWTSTGSFTGLIPGSYNVRMRDATNPACFVILNSGILITQPAALSAVLLKSDVTCFGASNGTITIINPAGGYGTYEYTIDGWATSQTTGTYTGLPVGDYNVQIRDRANPDCVRILDALLNITQPAILSASVASGNVTCNGVNDGTITISNATGGYGTYSYSISDGTAWQGSGIFTNLAPGTYKLRIRDAANPACIIPLLPDVVITEPPALFATAVKTNVTCFGASDGSITITGSTGGYGSYEYTINGGTVWQTGTSFTGLIPGFYNVKMRDLANPACIFTVNGSLNVTQPPLLAANVAKTNVTCFGSNDGTITISSPSGGYGTYEYSIAAGIWQATGNFAGLSPGNYNIQIRDQAYPGCFVTLITGLNISEPPLISASVAFTAVTCNGGSDGTITISGATGGSGSYEYSVNGGTGWSGLSNFSNLAPGSYNVQIRDASHTACVISLTTVIINQPAPLTATVAGTNVTCFGSADGTITMTNPSGGSGTYEYTINGGGSWQSSGSFTGLSAGTYNIRIRDILHPSCVRILNGAFLLTQPAVLSATLASTNVSCFGSSDGTITITNPLGGYGTYEYTINGGTSWQSSGSYTALVPGFYNVQIRDALNTVCTRILNGSLQISQPNLLAAFISKTDASCNGTGDGTITVSGATGGSGTYEYSIGGVWQATGIFTGLSPATYSVSIRDRAHPACVIVLDNAVVISQLTPLNASASAAMVTCNGANDGIITITGQTGGSGSYQYSVNGGTSWQGSPVFTNLANASYNVMMRDAVSPACLITINPALAITQPAPLAAVISSTAVTCFGGNDGTITISGPSGGNGTYEYSINGGGSWNNTGIFTALTPGFYYILIRDAGHISCFRVLNSSYEITQPGRLSATVTKTDVSCKGMNDGKITISSPSGGYGTYQYSVDGGTTWVASGNFINLLPATYDVRIRDAANNACSIILYPNLVISEPIQLALTTTGGLTLNCFGDQNGTGTFFGSGGTLPYSFHVISNTTGATIAAPGFNSQSFYNAGAGSITMAVTDFNGCFAQATIDIIQPLQLAAGTIGSNQVLCSGTVPAPLTETAPASGGPGTYNYQWQYGTDVTGPFINIAGATLSNYSPAGGVTNTIYFRRMVSSGICPPVYTNVVEIRVNPNPVAVLAGGESICPGQSSVLKVTMMAGTAPFELNIQNLGVVTGYLSGADIVVSPAATTTYTLLSVKDANGCTVTAPSPNLIGNATITVRALPVITASPVNKTVCEFGVTAFSVSATGSDLAYQWYVNTGSGFNPVTDGGVYFGATTATLNLFGATRLMNGYIYHAVVNGCSASLTSGDATLTVNTVPEIAIQPRDTAVCSGNNASFRVVATGTGISYQWQVNKGAGFINVINDANFSGANTNTLTITNIPGTFNNNIMRVIVSGVCGAPVFSNFAVLRVNTPPVVTLNPVDKATCENTGPITFTAFGSGLIDSLRWQVFRGGVWSDVHDNAIYNGSASQQLTLLNIPLALNGNRYRLALKGECITVYTNASTLTVNANPVVNFASVDPLHACGNVPLVLNGNPSGGSGTWTAHLWTGDVGPLNNYFVQSPTFNSPIAGTFNLNYKVKDSNGCFASDDVSVIVDAPNAVFTADKITGCTPATVTFTKDMTGIARFWWDFNDGSPIDSVTANPVHTFTNSNSTTIGYYNVNLKVRSPGGCIATFTSIVTVYPAIDATFTADRTVICSGNSITFTSIPGAGKYFWEFGDGVSGYSINTTSHVYTNFTPVPVIMQVKLTTTSFYSCTDVKTMNITVMPVPLPSLRQYL